MISEVLWFISLSVWMVSVLISGTGCAACVTSPHEAANYETPFWSRLFLFSLFFGWMWLAVLPCLGLLKLYRIADLPDVTLHWPKTYYERETPSAFEEEP